MEVQSCWKDGGRNGGSEGWGGEGKGGRSREGNSVVVLARTGILEVGGVPNSVAMLLEEVKEVAEILGSTLSESSG